MEFLSTKSGLVLFVHQMNRTIYKTNQTALKEQEASRAPRAEECQGCPKCELRHSRYGIGPMALPKTASNFPSCLWERGKTENIVSDYDASLFSEMRSWE